MTINPGKSPVMRRTILNMLGARLSATTHVQT
jgi:hypothetical protein